MLLYKASSCKLRAPARAGPDDVECSDSAADDLPTRLLSMLWGGGWQRSQGTKDPKDGTGSEQMTDQADADVSA